MMWSTDTVWFDISLVTGMTAFGTIFFGHFEQHTPKWRKALKLLMFICVVVTLTITAGRMWSITFLGICLVAVFIIHVFYLPSKGINGWTGEPKEKYYKLRGWHKHLKD